MRQESQSPDFNDIQKVFYELHEANEYQDEEFLNLVFPSVPHMSNSLMLSPKGTGKKYR